MDEAASMPRSSTRRHWTRTRLRWRCRRSGTIPAASRSWVPMTFSSNIRMAAPGHQDQFAPLRLSACYWFGELTFIGTSLERETRRFLPFAGSALAVVLPCLICRHRLRPLRLVDVADRAEYPAAHITLVSHTDDVE